MTVSFDAAIYLAKHLIYFFGESSSCHRETDAPCPFLVLNYSELLHHSEMLLELLMPWCSSAGRLAEERAQNLLIHSCTAVRVEPDTGICARKTHGPLEILGTSPRREDMSPPQTTLSFHQET
jgi:hypothetical protein